MSTATDTSTVSTASQERPAVLTQLGLGNELKTATEAQTNGTTTTEVADTSAAPAEKAVAPATTDSKPAATATDTKDAPSELDKDHKDLARLNKQLTDTRNAFTQERQVNKTLLAKQRDLEHKIDILMKKIDGTYDEATDGPKPVSPEQRDEEIRRQERIQASHIAAIEQYGEEYVMKTVWADDAPFRQFDTDLTIQQRVMSSKVPILEAIKVVKEAETKAKYGNDPDSMKKVLEKELRETLEKEVRDKISQELKSKGVVFESIKGLGGIASASAQRTPDQPTPLATFENLFPNFVKSAG